MDNSKDPNNTSNSIDTTSPDALSNPSVAAPPPDNTSGSSGQKKSRMPGLPGPLKKYSHRFNIYLLFFLLVLVVAGAILVITAMAGKEDKQDPSAISNQALSSDTLKQLSNSNATVGDPKQILTVQSNAVFNGKVLVRDSLEVAGEIKVGGPLSLPGITVSGESNFDQINVGKALNVGGDTSVQGQMNVKKSLSVSGAGTFGGTVTAPQVATNALQLLGDLTLTSHIVAGGPTPGHSNGGAVGGGGTASVSGSDTAGTVNINSGSNPAAGCFITVNFSSRYASTPHVLLTPASSSAGTIQYYVNRTSSGFSVCTANVPPAFSTFTYDYFVVN